MTFRPFVYHMPLEAELPARHQLERSGCFRYLLSSTFYSEYAKHIFLYVFEYITQSESISLSPCEFRGLHQSQVSDEILITPLIGNCEVFVARGVGSFSFHRSASYSAIDLCLIHLIVIIPPPYFIPFRDGGFSPRCYWKKLTRGVL